MSLATDESSASKDENQLVTFMLQDEEFGFNIMSVQEIIRLPKMAKVPRTPDYVEGLANLRGVVLPIIDTRTRFGMPRAAETDRTRVLVVDINGVKMGLRVDTVSQVTRVLTSQIEAPPPVICGTSGNYLEGVVKLDEGRRIIMELNPAKVCQIDVAAALVGATAAAAELKPAVADASAALHAMEQMVTFELAGEEFGFPIRCVREILRVAKPKEVPDTPDYVLGVLTVRGQILPILDLRLLLHQPSMTEELLASFQKVSGPYQRWAQSLGSVPVEPQAPEKMRRWISEFSTSSQALTETLSKLRSANDKLLKSPGNPDATVVDEALELVEKLPDLFSSKIMEDQRIIVVDANGLLLGLVVDHVREVLNVPSNLIDPPPRIFQQQGVDLAGIAKLDQGSRLIMVLDASQILKDHKLQENLRSSQSTTTTSEVRSTAHLRDEEQMVTFLLGQEEFGIPIAQIQEIDRHSQITRVPKSASFIEGVTNLRGEVIPVLDTRKRFGMPVRESDDRTRIIIVDLGGSKTGLLVDSVKEVLSLSRADIAPPPDSLSNGQENPFVAGIGKIDQGKRMVVVLDIQKILA